MAYTLTVNGKTHTLDVAADMPGIERRHLAAVPAHLDVPLPEVPIGAVEAGDTIVRSDRGRASELVQARKTQLQAEISRDTAIAQTRQIESRLRKLIGADFQPGDGITVPLILI